MPQEGNFLLVGGDDSNHAGDSKGEIIVATFSQIYDDRTIEKFLNRRDIDKTFKWINSDQRDYLFTVLSEERYRHSSANLVEIIPFLTKEYFMQKSILPKTLEISLDGALNRDGKQKIRDEFPYIEKVIVDNFTKKRRTRSGNICKYPRCPSVVYYADVLANFLYRNRSLDELISDEKFVDINDYL